MTRHKTDDNPALLPLRPRLRFLARDSLIYGGASAFNTAFSLITFPLLARYFSLGDFGLIDFFSVVMGLLTTTLVFGQDSSVARFFYEYTEVAQRRQIVSQSLSVQLGIVALVLPLLWLAVGYLARMLSASPDAEFILGLVLLQVPFQLLINFSQNLLKWTFSRSRFVIISMGSTILRALLLLVAVFWFEIGVAGVFVVGLVVQVVFGVLGIVFVRDWLARPVGFGYMRELWRFGIPYGVICSIALLTPVLERSIVSRLMGPETLGLYAAGAKLAILISVFGQAFQTAWGPFSLAVHKAPDAALTYNWILKGFVLTVCSLVLMLTSLADPIIRLIASERYAGATVVVFPLAMGLAVQATGWITDVGIGLSKKSHLTLYIYVVFLVVSGLSIYSFGQRFGLVGTALGVMVGYVSKALFSTYLAQRAYPLAWPLCSVLGLLSFTCLIGLTGEFISSHSSQALGSTVISAGIVVLWLLGWRTFSCQERHRLMLYISTRLRSIFP